MSNHSLLPHFWIKNYADYLFGIALFKVNDSQLAEDLVQDTFVSALESKDKFRGDASEKTWLTTILRNKIIDYYRKNSKMDSSKSTADEIASSDYFEADDDAPQGAWKAGQIPQEWSISADENMLKKELHSIIRKCIQYLPTKFVELMQMRYVDEIPSKLICKDLDISSSNYWVMLHRMHLQLRKCVESKW